MSAGERLDLVLFGATSYVGRLCAGYLARTAPPEVRIGLAGRSRERLEQLQASLGDPAAEWPLVIADTNDEASIDALARSARVVATTVGPYRRYGIPLVGACANAGTHYADLTGEVLFMREAIDRFDALASASGARIVHSCGFDSLPSDLGVLLLYEAAATDGSGELEDTTLVVRTFKGGPSGGTIASIKGTVDDARSDSGVAHVLADPYALSPDRGAEPQLGPETDVRGPENDRELGMWIGPFIMAAVNTRVVRRSNALQGWSYGRRFRYREVVGFGTGPLAPVLAGGTALGLGALQAGLAIGPTRAVLDRILPDPGEGPSEAARDRGRFSIDIHAHTSGGARYVCHVAAQGDPGYKATSAMFGESGLCLALDADKLPPRAGVLTPATAMGDALVERLRRAGQTYKVERVA